MIRRRTLVRRIVVFGAVACAALALVLVRPARTAPPRKQLTALFPGLDPAAVASVRIERTTKRDGKDEKDEVVLERSGPSEWKLQNRGGYPAKVSQVARFLDQLRDAKERVINTTDPSKAAAFAGADGYTEVTVAGTGRAPLARFGLGKSGAGGSYEGVYVRVGEPPAEGAPVGVTKAPAGDFRVVTAEGLEVAIRSEAEDWIDRDLWPAISGSDLVAIEIDQREKGRTIALVREEKKPEPPKEGATPGEPPAAPADSWRIEKPTAGPASPSAASTTASEFANLSLERLVAPSESATDAEYGFDKPTLVVTAKGRLLVGEDAPTYSLTVGKKVEGRDAFYVRRGADAFVFEVSKGSLREFESDPESWAEKKPDEKPGEKPEGPAEGAKPGEAPTTPGTPTEPKPGERKPGEEKPGEPGPGEPGTGAPDGQKPGEEKPGAPEGGAGEKPPAPPGEKPPPPGDAPR